MTTTTTAAAMTTTTTAAAMTTTTTAAAMTTTTHFTKFPNVYLNNIEKFTPNEFKVLALIVRKNIGYQGYHEPPSMEFSISYLVVKTGGTDKTVIKAVRGLIEKKAIRELPSGKRNIKRLGLTPLEASSGKIPEVTSGKIPEVTSGKIPESTRKKHFKKKNSTTRDRPNEPIVNPVVAVVSEPINENQRSLIDRVSIVNPVVAVVSEPINENQRSLIDRVSSFGVMIKIPEWIRLFALYGILGLTESMEYALKRQNDPKIDDFSRYLASCIRNGYGIKTEEERKQAEKDLIDEARKSKLKSIILEDGMLVRWIDGNTYEIEGDFMKGLSVLPYNIRVAIADGQAEIVGKAEKKESTPVSAAEIRNIPEILFQTPKKRQPLNKKERARVLETKARVSEEEARAIIAEQKRRLAESGLLSEKPVTVEQRPATRAIAIRFPVNPAKRFPEPLVIQNHDVLPEYDRLAARTSIRKSGFEDVGIALPQ